MSNTLQSASSATPFLLLPSLAVILDPSVYVLAQARDVRGGSRKHERGAGAELLRVVLPPGSLVAFSCNRGASLSCRAGTQEGKRCKPCAVSCVGSGVWRSKQTMTGVENSDCFEQPLRQWILPEEDKVQRVLGGIWFYRDRVPRGAGDSLDPPSRAMRNSSRTQTARKKQSVGEPEDVFCCCGSCLESGG
jgi:hypothetical protein